MPEKKRDRFAEPKTIMLSLLISPDSVFDASLVPRTCPNRFVHSREVINKFLESRFSTTQSSDYPGKVSKWLPVPRVWNLQSAFDQSRVRMRNVNGSSYLLHRKSC